MCEERKGVEAMGRVAAVERLLKRQCSACCTHFWKVWSFLWEWKLSVVPGQCIIWSGVHGLISNTQFHWFRMGKNTFLSRWSTTTNNGLAYKSNKNRAITKQFHTYNDKWLQTQFCNCAWMNKWCSLSQERILLQTSMYFRYCWAISQYSLL